MYRDSQAIKQKNINGTEEGSEEGNVSSSESEDEDELKASGERFEIVFDKDLFEPPEIVKITFFKLETMAKTQAALKNAQKNPNQKW